MNAKERRELAYRASCTPSIEAEAALNILTDHLIERGLIKTVVTRADILNFHGVDPRKLPWDRTWPVHILLARAREWAWRNLRPIVIKEPGLYEIEYYNSYIRPPPIPTLSPRLVFDFEDLLTGTLHTYAPALRFAEMDPLLNYIGTRAQTHSHSAVEEVLRSLHWVDVRSHLTRSGKKINVHNFGPQLPRESEQ